MNCSTGQRMLFTYAGGNYSKGKEDWGVHVVVDRELVTGQNNKSSSGVGKAVLELLAK